MPHQHAKVKEKYRPKSAKLMDQVREVLRYHHYAECSGSHLALMRMTNMAACNPGRHDPRLILNLIDCGGIVSEHRVRAAAS